MKILLVDDHPIFRKGLKFILSSSFDDLDMEEFNNGKELIQYLENEKADIVLVDIDMPEMNGLEVCLNLRNMGCTAKIIVLTMHKELEMLKLAFFNGADGYLVKENTSEELVDCIQTVLEGRNYMAKGVRDQTELVNPENIAKYQIAKMLELLTRTELKTLKLVSRKLSSKEIADQLFVTVKSVENYRSRICKKLNLDARNNSLLMWVMENKSIIDAIK